ncbi:MAG TPA: D-alanyl-D-alanine carboxypeptidase family protein, partial [Hyphomicrobiales bacterium]|nr:D-alanyl-D-alanine carboxypeptidase family protein [Hyphomicrobiales bacterium]
MMARIATALAALAATLLAAAEPVMAKPELLIDADSGRVLFAQDATLPWYPASLTKLMTTYVILNAVRQGRIKLTTPIVYSARAAEEKPSKWGLKVGTVATVDNVLKMMLVKSANDLAVMLAEGLDGSVENFVAEMNATAQRLGMTQSHFVNPNGWWEPDHVSSARDMAIVADALVREFPQSLPMFDIRAVQLGDKITRGHNRILGLFPGAEGMKTGFTCPSGFNLVALASRGNRRLIAVLMGYDNDRSRTEAAAKLLTEGFGTITFWRVGAPVQALAPVAAEPPNLRDEVCHKRPQQEAEDTGDATPLSGLVDTDAGQPYLAKSAPPIVPVRVFLGTTPP